MHSVSYYAVSLRPARDTECRLMKRLCEQLCVFRYTLGDKYAYKEKLPLALWSWQRRQLLHTIYTRLSSQHGPHDETYCANESEALHNLPSIGCYILAARSLVHVGLTVFSPTYSSTREFLVKMGFVKLALAYPHSGCPHFREGLTKILGGLGCDLSALPITVSIFNNKIPEFSSPAWNDTYLENKSKLPTNNQAYLFIFVFFHKCDCLWAPVHQ